MDFFRDHSDAFDLFSRGLRECQVGAFCAARAHFSLSSDPCLLSLPTGSGKTALMMALSFGLRAKRVLIISPARVLRVQTADKFASLSDLRDVGAINLPDSERPKVMSIEEEVRSAAVWRKYADFDVLTATTRTTSPFLKQIALAPKGFFDLVFIDEAHHEPAKTWRSLVDSFERSKTKIVLLTGTPYRRDRRPIAATLKYAYPIARALQDKIFAAVRFVNAGSPETGGRDPELAKRGIQQLRRLARHGAKPLLLAKSDRIAHAESLVGIYKDNGLVVKAVHSGRSEAENIDIIEAARTGTIGGLVVVGMLGEGLDIPELKVAVFHRNPQSLPYTLQIIGRLARVPESLKHGVVVGYSSDFNRDTFRLYDGGEDWIKLIPELESRLISNVGPQYVEKVDDTGAEIQLADVRPYFSATVERRQSEVRKEKQKGSTFKVTKGHAVIVLDEEIQDDFRVIVTATQEVPSWLQIHGQSSAVNRIYDLHAFYFGQDRLVIAQSTNSKLAKDIRDKLFKSARVQAHELRRVMSANDGTYTIVGLQSSGGISRVVPTYKMLMGSSAESAILNVDRAGCTPGHCVMKFGEQRDAEWRGVAFANSKVWSMDRDNLMILYAWMKEIESAVLNDGFGSLPRLEYLRSAIPFEVFPGKPVAIFWSTRLLNKRVVFVDSGLYRHEYLPDLKPESNWSGTKGNVSLNEFNISVEVGLNDDCFSIKSFPETSWTVEVDDGTRIQNFSLDEFLDEYPPSLIFRDGSTFSDRIYTKPNTNPAIDYGCLKVQDWLGTTITKEIPGEADEDSIHQYVNRLVQLKDDVIGVYDHGTREIADFVAFDQVTQMISLYHCKASEKPKPGTRQEDMEELVAQGMASCRWIRSRELPNRLSERIEQNGSRLIAGSLRNLTSLSADFEPTLWKFAIVLVQPGLSSAKLRTSNGSILRPLIACAQDYVRGTGAEFSIMCGT